MLIRLQSYDVELKFKPGRDMIVADTLSRAFRPTTSEGANFTEEIALLSMTDAEHTAVLNTIASTATIKLLMQSAADD
jgi:hypothetical protein